MRLYSMYILCKSNIEAIKAIKIDSRIANGNSISFVGNWLDTVKVLNKLANVPGLKQATTDLYESVPIFFRNRDRADMDATSIDRFTVAQGNLVSSMNTIISMYENMGIEENSGTGFDMKLPQFNSIKDFSSCINDIEFIVDQCPYLRRADGEIKFKSVDVGSFWITFLIVGTAAGSMLLSLSKLVDAAVKIKSHVATVKQQEEVLRAMELKNNIAGEIVDTFKQVNKSIVDNCVHDLEADLGPLKDGEEIDKVGRAIQKLADWMNKGLQIYSAIDAPKEVKDLFPPQEEQPLLNDEIIKLIEQKENNKE